MLEFVLHSLSVGLWGFLFSSVLSREGEAFTFYHRAIDKLPFWIAKPLGRCGKCHAGWVALITYPLRFEYNGLDHFGCVVFAIFIAFYAENRF